MSLQDHTTAFDGQTLDQQDPATQELFFGTWGNWARVRWVLERNHAAGQSDPVPVVAPADARSGNLPGGIPCAGGSQCASGVCHPPEYICASALVDKSKVDQQLLNPGVVATGDTTKSTNNLPVTPVQTDVWKQLTSWANSFTLSTSVFGPTGPRVSNGLLAAGGGLLLMLMSGGHHRRGGLL